MAPTKRLQTAIEFAGDNGLPTNRVYVRPDDATGMTPPLGTHLVLDPRVPRGQFWFVRDGGT
ncbi:MAG: hypothetical protein KC442_03600 [Thermomicrobiales bacterium]|nr:hypothetical protein [Thermomicrobiales bacterium]